MAGRENAWLSTLVIVSGLAACDNVEWGGASARLEPAPPATVGAAVDSAEAEAAEPAPPEGPVLFTVVRDSTGGRLSPVGEISGDSLLALPTEEEVPGYRTTFVRERMPRAARYLLFARGTRVGTFTVREHFTDETSCRPRPAARGPIELVPDAVGVTRFIALRSSLVDDIERQPFPSADDVRPAGAASINMAAELIPELDARWPTSLAAARRELTRIRLSGEDAFASTFLFRDRLVVEPAAQGAWSLFLLGTLREGAYARGYVWYRDSDAEGKGIPRYFAHFDWDRDGEDELLLEVLGESARWTAALGARNGEWRRVWEDPCGRSPRSPAAEG